ncbi:hypothetical protein FACS18948_6670 [Clostridia bacterium]|nr:hypothetical protein FACS18948_6670 [Clostridia bacterium]
MSDETKRKLSSRKLWCAAVGFVTALAAMLGWSDATVERVAALVMAVGALVAYILAEGWADAAGAKLPALPELIDATEAQESTDAEQVTEPAK